MRILRLSVTALAAAVTAVFLLVFFREIGKDSSVPEIIIENDNLEISISAGDEELLAGVTAYDEKDGDITDRVIVESISRFTDPGTSIVKYSVCDNDNHVTSAKRRVTYTDYEPPRFTLSSPLLYSTTDTVNILNRLGAVDVIDGKINNKVVITMDEENIVAGSSFRIIAKVTNSKGDSSTISLPVYVEDINIAAPVIKLGEYIVYLDVGESFDIDGNLLSITSADGSALDLPVTIDTDANFNEPGIYEAHYYATDSDGRRGHSVLTIIVEE